MNEDEMSLSRIEAQVMYEWAIAHGHTKDEADNLVSSVARGYLDPETLENKKEDPPTKK